MFDSMAAASLEEQPERPAVKSAAGINSTGNKIPEGKLTYSDDRFLGKPMPHLDDLVWLQGEEMARAALASPTIKVVLFWAKFPKGDWHAIQQCEKLAKKHPSVQFIGISCDILASAEETVNVHANGQDHKDINMYNFKFTFPAAFDPDVAEGGKTVPRGVQTAFKRLGGLSSLGAGHAFIVDQTDTIVWRELIENRWCSSSEPEICMRYWQNCMPDSQFPDQLSLLVNGCDLVSNGPRPVEEDDGEADECEMGEGVGACVDAFADGEGGDY